MTQQCYHLLIVDQHQFKDPKKSKNFTVPYCYTKNIILFKIIFLLMIIVCLIKLLHHSHTDKNVS
jgi:hypothetical protein